MSEEIYEMEKEDLRNMQMNILNCQDNIKDRLGNGKVNWESELELSCAERKCIGCLPEARIKAFIQIIRLYSKSFFF